MINFPNSGFKIAGLDLMKMFAVVFQILLDKGITTENELVGALIKAGFPFNSKPQSPSGTNVDFARHEKDCLCEGCQRTRGIQ